MKTALHWAVVVGALGYTGYKVPPLFEAAGQAGRLGELRWGWVMVALLLGLAAVVLYGEIHRRLLAVGGARLSPGTVQAITFAENAVSETVPVVGGAGAIAYAISRFHRRGADTEVAAWSVLLSAAVATFCLAGMAPVALGVIGRLPVVVAGALFVAVVAVGVGAWALVTHPGALRRLLRPVMHLAEYVPGRCSTCRAQRLSALQPRVDAVAARLGMLRPSAGQWLGLVVVSCLTYVLDFAALATASAAVLPVVPWSALVWGYLLVQASIALQVLPGGAGLAEVGLLGALLAAGVPAAPGAGVVLIYRVASWLLPSAVGWVLYAGQIHVIRPRPHLHLQSAAA